jgi:hypothetical protein
VVELTWTVSSRLVAHNVSETYRALRSLPKQIFVKSGASPCYPIIVTTNPGYPRILCMYRLTQQVSLFFSVKAELDLNLRYGG